MHNLAKEKKVALVVGISLILIGLVKLILPHDDYPAGQLRTEINFSIPEGATGTWIAEHLVSAGVIKKSKTFIANFNSNRLTQGISAGVHILHTHADTKIAVMELLDRKRIINGINVIEGKTLGDIERSLRSNSHIDSQKTDLSAVINPFGATHHSLEGVLYPASYSFEPGTKYQQAIESMVKRFTNSAEFSKLKNAHGKFSPYQLLTIASMVQIEGDTSSYNKVARVIFNRLAIGMPLQLNSTVQYAAGLRGRISLSNKATQINSPYNTYKNLGLPPTPISISGPSAIDATLNPSLGDWLYFITVKPGDTRFTKSFEEFSKWNTEFNNNNANGAFK